MGLPTAPDPLTGKHLVDPFRVGEVIPENVQLMGRTAEENDAFLQTRQQQGVLQAQTNFLDGLKAIATKNGFADADFSIQDAQVKATRDKAVAAEKEFFRIAAEVDKLAQLPGPGGQGTRNNVRGPLEDVRRAEQKTAVFDQAARERRGRSSTIQASRGGGGGSSSSGVTGLSASTFTKTLLGG